MKLILKIATSLILLFLTLISFASGKFLLQDTNCVLVGPTNDYKIVTLAGGLINSVCVSNNGKVICLNTDVSSPNVDNKPSYPTEYREVRQGNLIAWFATGGILILDLKRGKYSFASYFYPRNRDNAIFNKNCVGTIKSVGH